MEEIYICVGSLNPTKINATKIAFSKYFDIFQLFKIKGDSKVPNQPIGLKTIIKGAINRATNALNFLIETKKVKDRIYGVGIEAGLANIPYTRTNYMDFQFCVIMDEFKNISLGSGVAFEYPQSVINHILSNDKKEIGEIIGKLAGNINLKNEAGAISFLSNNAITRTEILTQAVICALLPYVNKKLYQFNKKEKKIN
ncbi:MAG: inosine/xanthosine triphosphatase [Promethearchaeota archaeon]